MSFPLAIHLTEEEKSLESDTFDRRREIFRKETQRREGIGINKRRVSRIIKNKRY